MGKSNIKSSQVHAYAYILKELKGKKGWSSHKIYTQQECLKHPEFKKYFGDKYPENIVEIDAKTYYIIEAENERKKLDIALKDAREYYSDKVNKSNVIQVKFITGIAGNDEEGFIARSQFYKNGKWETITENEVEITGLLSKKQIEGILQQQTSNLKDIEITEEEFLGTAKEINEILHENSIDKSYRARFISAILLAMSDNKEIDVTQECDVLIDHINSKVKAILKKHDKLNFSNFIKIDEPSSSDNHIKVKEAIKRTYQKLLGLNIHSAMNSGKDVLGKFYEVFLKYGNGAKDIGIVLTPRHITHFASEVLDITYKDLVLDPACGTAGFLVSAFDEVRRKTKNKEDFEKFRLHGIYGIEEQDAIISLALVNMIFRRDGKNHMIEGNCFKKYLNTKIEGKDYFAEYLSDNQIDKTDEGYYYPNPENKEIREERIPPITKVMMNPPFALKKGAEREYKFIEHALKQMVDEGILFAILPISVLVEKGTKEWRRDILLKNNRLLAVITFPEDLFNPSASVGTVGLFVQKGTPHDFLKDRVFFARCMQDGYKMKKGVRKESKKVKNQFEEIKEELKNFIKNPNVEKISVPEFKRICLLDANDKNTELVAEAYIESRTPTQEEIQKGIEEIIREALAFKIKFNNQLEVLEEEK